MTEMFSIFAASDLLILLINFQNILWEYKKVLFELLATKMIAERQGFEPWKDLHPQRFSRPPRSTTPASLH